MNIGVYKCKVGKLVSCAVCVCVCDSTVAIRRVIGPELCFMHIILPDGWKTDREMENEPEECTKVIVGS